jgi:iron(III) transport system ATP-binding protein
VVCEGLSKRFGSTVALDRIDIEVASGEILALLGPSGCGKTTFLRVLAGFERADAGRVSIAGREVAGPRAFVEPSERRVGFVFQDYALFPHLSVADNVGFGVPRSQRRHRVAEMLELLDLGGLQDRSPAGLSGGQQQRVALARALAPRPEVMLLDEPFSNLDADLRVRVRAEVGDILRRSGTTTVFVTHDQQEAFDVADRVAVMRAGRFEQVGRAEEVYHLPQTRFVADFVGEAHLLPVRVEGDRIVSELGAVPLGVARLEAGETAEVLLRPEDIALGPPGVGPEATVTQRRFHGPTTLTTIRLSSGREVTSAHSSQRVFAVGSLVSVRLNVDHVVLFRGEHALARLDARPVTGTHIPPEIPENDPTHEET